MKKDKCLIPGCGMKTSNIVEESDGEKLPICTVCEAKYGDKIGIKLNEIDIPEKYKVENNELEAAEPFKAKIEISGGTKNDRIDIIVGLMDHEDISIEEIEARQF